MPKIAQFFATGKITPSSAGTEAWETAGRRIGPLYNQIGEGDKEVGKAIAALWDQYRLGIIEPHGGGGGSAHGGSVQTPISFGRNPGEPRVPYTDPQQYNKYSGPAGQFNARAHQEISQAAPTLIDVATQLASQAGPSGVTVLRGGQSSATSQPTGYASARRCHGASRRPSSATDWVVAPARPDRGRSHEPEGAGYYAANTISAIADADNNTGRDAAAQPGKSST